MLIQKCGPFTKIIDQTWRNLSRFDMIEQKSLNSFNSMNNNTSPSSKMSQNSKSLYQTPVFSYSTFFLQGLDNRTLNVQQQKEMKQMVEKDPKGTSFLIYNSVEAERKITNWKKTLPWIRPFYAIQSNPIKELLRDLKNHGAGLDCASKAEIQLALNMGLAPHEIVYSNPVKEDQDIQWAARKGVTLTTADTIDELKKIQQIAPKMKILWRIAIKEDDAQKLSTTFSGQFGDDILSVTPDRRFKQIRDMGIQLSGIHFHCGSGQHGSASFAKAVNMARECIKIGRQYGHTMEILDLGGGFPSLDLNERTIDALEITKNDPLGYTCMAEPGRHFSANTGYLATRVLAQREKNGRNCVHLNDSLYHSFNCILMDGVNFENSNDQFYSLIREDGVQKSAQNLIATDSSIFGMTCDGMDVLAKNINLPVDLKVGDWLVFGGMGAYTVGPRSQFNGMKALSRIEQWSGVIETEKTVKETSAEVEGQPTSVFGAPSTAQPFITMNSSSSNASLSSDEENIVIPVTTEVNRN